MRLAPAVAHVPQPMQRFERTISRGLTGLTACASVENGIEIRVRTLPQQADAVCDRGVERPIHQGAQRLRLGSLSDEVRLRPHHRHQRLDRGKFLRFGGFYS